jgi:hypothetical protein
MKSLVAKLIAHLPLMSDTFKAKIWFFYRCRYWPNTRNPTSFNEKVLHRKLFLRDPLYITLVDKLAVRDFVKSKVGFNVLTDVYQVVTDPRDINMSLLPSHFVLKSNHGSGQVMIVRNKSQFNIEEACETLSSWLSKDYGQAAYKQEWAYGQVKPKLYCEELLGDGQNQPPDYKFYVYHGKVHFLQIEKNRFTPFHTRTILSRSGEILPVTRGLPFDELAVKPEGLDALISVAEAIGTGLDFARVDLYQIGSRIVFGEITLYPGSGTGPFSPRSYDYFFGQPWTSLV